MNTFKTTLVAAALAAASLSFAGTANAAPVGGVIGKAVSTDQATNLEQVGRRHYRKHRYSHRRGYRSRGYGYYRGYRARPGFGIYIGPRYGYYGHYYGPRRYWR